ncbi:ROK family transcriptional regulator [Desulfovibrio inopinatus]|uniref:ROK family transcriptional regulator n=1 Tax=Desulfovibrio inopinatus TaxID=102109 RepID=UPI0004030929|nr:ROK family transcriptional regulator [Desulfovibrio inopinatus]
MSNERPDPIRMRNRLRILKKIRRAGSISRVELSARTGCSRATVTNITAELIERGIIYEKETRVTESKGRRRVMLAIDPTAAYVVGVKVMAFNIGVAVIDFAANVLGSLSIPVRSKSRPLSHLADIIEDGVRICIKESKIEKNHVRGIGMAIPGFVDHEHGRCLWTPLYNDSQGDLCALVYERLGIPAFIENDANAITLAEQWFGHGQDIDDFLLVSIEQGVGLGIVVNGELYRGHSGIGAEFGHVVIEPGGRRCRCGKNGCIEAYAGGDGIMRAVSEANASGLWTHPSMEMLSLEEVIDLAQSGDPFLQSLFHRGGEVLGQGISSLLQIFNPAKIIITGQYVSAGEMLFAPMRQTIKSLTNTQQYEATEFVVLQWQATDWARGAASIVLQEMYESPFDHIKA